MKKMVLNEDESTDGVCYHCKEKIGVCEREITCQDCEDAMPRRHECSASPTHCEFCGEAIEDCHCQPSGHYD